MKRLKFFIGMETSGTLRRAFEELGHIAISCDLLPAEDKPSAALVGSTWLTTTHLVGDVFEMFNKLAAEGVVFDGAVLHPDCTYLTNAAAWAFKDGPYHQKVKPGTLVGAVRRGARLAALDTVRRCMALPVQLKAVENPVGAISRAIRKPDQIVHPFQFGDDASKGTCLWFDGPAAEGMAPIPLGTYCKPRMLCPACKGTTNYSRAHHGCKHCGAEAGRLLPRWSNQTDSGENNVTPGAGRWKERSRTYPGIAKALAAHMERTLLLHYAREAHARP